MPRADARAADQLRPIRIVPGYLKYADGSVLIEVGDTRVVCSASLEERVPQWRKGQGEGWITAEYQMIPRSTEVRTPREVGRGQFSGRTHEIQRMIGRSMRAAVETRGIGERTLWLDCDVIQADGGTRTAAVTGAYIALALALKRCLDDRKIGRIPLREMVAATSVGVVGGELLLDLSYREDQSAGVDMNVVMTGSGRLIEVQGTAEGAPFDRAQMNAMLDLAAKGIRDLVREQRRILGDLVATLPFDSGQR